MKLSGYKGYVSNIPADVMSAVEVISSYHDLWHVEQSFRMSKTDLKARPIFHRTRDAIEAHLTVVFTALAVARSMQDETGVSLKKIITSLRPLREFTGRVGWPRYYVRSRGHRAGETDRGRVTAGPFSGALKLWNSGDEEIL